MLGAGNVATHLGMALVQAGYEVVQVYSRTEASASALAGRLHCPYVTRLEEVASEAGLYIVSVKDSALDEVASALSGLNPDALFVHTTGSMPMDVWKGRARRYGVLYPMQTFSKERAVDFSTVPFFIEAGAPADAEVLRGLALRLGGMVYEATSEQRRYLHLSAVFACNFTNHLYAVAHRLLADHGLPFEALLPLIDETARKVHCLSPVQAQTGPAVRADENVMQAHRALLAGNPRLASLYEALSRDIHEYAIHSTKHTS